MVKPVKENLSRPHRRRLKKDLARRTCQRIYKSIHVSDEAVEVCRNPNVEINI